VNRLRKDSNGYVQKTRRVRTKGGVVSRRRFKLLRKGDVERRSRKYQEAVPDDKLTTKQLAAIFMTTETTILRYIANGRLSGEKVELPINYRFKKGNKKLGVKKGQLRTALTKTYLVTKAEARHFWFVKFPDRKLPRELQDPPTITCGNDSEQPDKPLKKRGRPTEKTLPEEYKRIARAYQHRGEKTRADLAIELKVSESKIDKAVAWCKDREATRRAGESVRK
jgi:predicted HTH transcriptional regulator